MKKKATLYFNNLPTSVETVKRVPPKYYHEEDKNIPKKYIKGLDFYYGFIDGILCHLSDNSPVVKNFSSAHKPRKESILSNHLHQLSFNPKNRYTVLKIKSVLKEYFLKELGKKRRFRITKFPIIIEMKIYMDLQSASLKDEDGISEFYIKVFRDCIQDFMIKFSGKKQVIVSNPVGFIPNDNTDYIIGGQTRVFHTEDVPYCIVNIYQYENQEEKECDFKNIPYERPNTILNSAASKIADRLAVSLLKRKGATDLYDRDGEVVEKYKDKYMNVYDYYFDIITEEFSTFK